MTQIARDLRKLRWHLGAFATLLAVAALLTVWSHTLAEQTQGLRNRTAGAFRKTEARLRQVRTEEQEIKDKSALFLKLMNTGVIGEEHRLDWTELLRDHQHQLRLPQMTYEFAPQKPLEGGSDGSYAFYSSPMKLHLQLVHEGDLLNFLAAIQQDAKAMVIVRACDMSRQLPTADSGGLGALNADCELDWVTAHGPGADTR